MDPTIPDRLKNLPSWLLTQTGHHAHRLVTEGLSEAGARAYHYRLLAALEEAGPSSQATLGRLSSIHLSDLVSTINELAESDLVRREPDPADRRRNVITITPAGRRRLKALDKQIARIQDNLLAPLSGDERAQLTGLLARVLHHHGQHA